MRMTRRRFTQSAAAVGAMCASPLARAAAPAGSLGALAREKGILFGTAMSAAQISDDAYVELVRRECDVIVAENEHKWYVIRADRAAWNFAPADALADFAKNNSIAMRGHTLLWHHPRWLPDWVNALDFKSAAEAETMLGEYIGKVAGRYAPLIHSWDVVNETIDDETGKLRETSFSRAMGADVIEFCFHKAREAAPGARLAYNDYMSWEQGSAKHRAGVLKLLERLKKNDAPIDALGVQSHSNYDMPDEFTPAKRREWRRFMDEVVGMGLEVYLTEFDVNDTRMTPDIAIRDQIIASYTKDYLDLMFSYPQVKELLAWGLVDKYSWLQTFLPRTDGVEKRPTLFDSSYAKKPIYDAVAAAIRAAPLRGPGM